jgi:NAD(P)-dependent dehydrogenase (short-subunit alcohol dehydrogenase family)
MMLTRGYSGTRAYCQSKLAQVMFTIDLAAELAQAAVWRQPACTPRHT